MKAGKGIPLQIPANKLDGSAYDWSGKTTRWEDSTDLPVLYLPSNIVTLPGAPVICFQGSQANAQGMPIRRPNVLFHTYAEQIAEEITLNGDYLQRANRLGLIVASPPSPPASDGRYVATRSLLAGLPLVGNSENEDPLDTDKFVGGRLAVVNQLSADDFVSYLTTLQKYTIYPGSDEYCQTFTYGAGQISEEVKSGQAGGITDRVNYYEDLSADTDYLKDAARRLDRIAVLGFYFSPEQTSETLDPQSYCFDSEGSGNVLVPAEGGEITINNSAYISAYESLCNEVFGMAQSGSDGIVTVRKNTYPEGQYHKVYSVDELLQFFEAD